MSPRLLPALYTVSATAAVVVCGPLLGAFSGDRFFLFRDAVSTPRAYVTDSTLGIGDTAPRAVPQDWLIAVTGPVAGGGIVTAALTVVALMMAGVGFGRLAARLVPSASTAPAVVAAIVAIWNPYVAERLLQGHWSLLVSYAALGHLAVALIDATRTGPRSDAGRWARRAPVAVSFACAGFTPTGSVLAGVLAITVWACGSRDLRGAASTIRWWLLGSLPWITSAILGGAPATSGSGGVAAFGLRAEPGLGTAGTVAGLGGIWNADAVPTSRTFWWAAAATGILLVLVAAGTLELRRRAGSGALGGRRVVIGFAVLAAAVLVMLTFSATPPGETALERLIDTVPGTGLLRDTQKYAALLMPFIAIAIAAAVSAMSRWVPAAFAGTIAALLIVAPLPDLAWGVGGKIDTVAYPPVFAEIAAAVPADRGDVALYPPGPVRRYPFAGDQSLDPFPRMLRAPVLESGRLTVDGEQVDAASGRAAHVDDLLAAGAGPAELAAAGVGWLIVEHTPTPSGFAGQTPVISRDGVSLYEVSDSVVGGSAYATRAAAWAAHLVWLVTIVGGLAICWATRRRNDQRVRPGTTRSKTSTKPSAVADHE